jgi:hypothetical protein
MRTFGDVETELDAAKKLLRECDDFLDRLEANEIRECFICGSRKTDFISVAVIDEFESLRKRITELTNEDTTPI